MTATEATGWTERLKSGVIGLADVPVLESLEIPRLLELLGPYFPVRFLEGQQRNGKREIGLARERNSAAETHTFRRCLLLTSEGGRLTTVAVLSQLVVRVKQGEDETLELVSASGFSLFRDPDGWKVKTLEEKTVSLSRQTLQARGWHLDLGAEER
jgi:hypothetical protein